MKQVGDFKINMKWFFVIDRVGFCGIRQIKMLFSGVIAQLWVETNKNLAFMKNLNYIFHEKLNYNFIFSWKRNLHVY